VFFVRDSTGSKLNEAIKNKHIYMSPVTSQHDGSEKSRVPQQKEVKTPYAPKGKSDSAGKLRLGFKLLQRNTPAITVGPDTLLQGDGARGP